MKFYRLFFSGLLWLTSLYVYGQQIPEFLGSRATGLGNAVVACNDGTALLYNPAAMISYDSAAQITLAANKNLNIEGLGSELLQVLLPLRPVIAGFAVKHSGDALYNESKAIVGLAHQIRNVSLGGSVQLLQIDIKDYGTKLNFIMDFGGLITFSKKLKIGASMYNITQSSWKLGNEDTEPLPVIMKIGLAYRPAKQVLFLYELNKQVEYTICHKMGLEYNLKPWFKVRGGVNTYPFKYALGFGFNKAAFIVDLSYSLDRNLGNSGGLTLTYHLRKGLF